MEMVEIAGESFPVHRNGMTLVDSFYIPDANVKQYCADRERCAQLVEHIMAQHCRVVGRDFHLTEDGEAVVGRDRDGQIQLLVHLDPETVGELLKAHRFGQLENYVLQSY